MITGNESYNVEMQPDSTPSEQIFYRPTGGLTIFQELSARFMVLTIDICPDLDDAAQHACDAAYELINEWNRREQSKTK